MHVLLATDFLLLQGSYLLPSNTSYWEFFYRCNEETRQRLQHLILQNIILQEITQLHFFNQEIHLDILQILNEIRSLTTKATGVSVAYFHKCQGKSDVEFMLKVINF